MGYPKVAGRRKRRTVVLPVDGLAPTTVSDLERSVKWGMARHGMARPFFENVGPVFSI